MYCTVYLISTYVDHFVLYQYLCGTTLYFTVYLIRTHVGPLCIATVGICLISRPTYMWDHCVLHCDCLPHQYLCGTTLYCTITYVGPLCFALFTSSVHIWDHFVLHQYLCGTTFYCTVYLISTYVGPLCIVSVPMWDHFVLHCLPHQYLCGTPLYCISTYVGPLCIALFTSPVPIWTTLYCNNRYMPHQ